MIFWMLSVTLFTTCMAIAAWCAEWALRARRRPARGAWLFAFCTSVVWAVLVARPRVVGAGNTAAVTLIQKLPAIHVDSSVTTSMPLERLLWGIWAVTSVILLVRALRALTSLRAAQRTATVQVIDGVPVLVTRDIGPAVAVGPRSRVLVPQSVLELDAPLQHLIIAHEMEHHRSGDPWLIIASTALTAVLPWNLPLWWMSSRLRAALEMDCDARVIAHGANATEYGKLLLLVAHRQSLLPLSPMLAESTSHLERRITAMRRPHTPSTLRVLLATLGASVALFAACSSRIDGPLTAPSMSTPNMISEHVIFFEFQVNKPAGAIAGSGHLTYPAELRSHNVQGVALMQFVVDEKGSIEPGSIKELKATHPLFAQAAREGLASMKFTPAETQGHRVRQLVQMPFTFSLSQ